MLISQRRKEDLIKLCITLLAVASLLVALASQTNHNSVGAASVQTNPNMSFFATSAKSKTGNLGGLSGAGRIYCFATN